MLVEQARDLAHMLHDGQTYARGKLPFTYHVNMVADYARRYNHLWKDEFPAVEHLVAAAYLHDTIEDTGITQQGLTQAIGDDIVAHIVWCLTDGTEGNRKARHEAAFKKINESPWRKACVYVKLCDSLANTYQSCLGQEMDRLVLAKTEYPAFRENLWEPQFETMFRTIRKMIKKGRIVAEV